MRKWTYLVATLLMAGTTATFTGCIDTDEPEGIAELRGAKSEFIKAQAAVELVEAELRKAQVAEQELVNAGLALQNKSAEIDLQLHELDIQVKKLLIEKEEAATAQAKAEAEAAIAKAEADKTKWENEKALIVEQYKEKMLLAETATAKAQEAYKQAMEQIEASKILLTDEEQIRLNVVEAKVAYAKIAMDKAMYGYSTTEVKTEQRLVSKSTSSQTSVGEGAGTTTTTGTDEKYITYYVITQKPDNANNGYAEGSLKKLQEQLADYPNWVADGNIEAKLKNAVEIAESNLNIAQKTADGYKAILDNEYTTLADWEAEVKKLKDEMATLDVQKRQYELKKEELKVANPNLEKNKTAAKKKLDDAKEALNKVNATTNVASAYSKKADQSILKGLNDAFDGISDGVDGYNKSTGEFSYAKTVLVTKAQEQIDGWNKLIDAATQGIDLEDLAWSKLEVVKAEAEATKANETYDADYKTWEKARDKYIEVEAIDIDASKKAAEAAIAAYNKLGDAARTQDANISKLATALAEYYQDALGKELKSTKAEATETSTNTKKAISAWIIANPLTNFKSIVGLELNLIEWTAGAVTKANKIEQADANKLLELGASAGDIPYESWKKASTKVFGDKFNRDNEPRRVAVSADMVLKEVNGNRLATELQDGDYGTLGISIYATAEAASLTAVINQADTYKALKAEFTAQKAKEQATLDKKKTELAANVTKAQTALTDAEAAYDKVFKEVEANIKKVSEDYDYKDAIKDKIESTISDYIASLDELGDDYKDMTLEEIKEAINAEYLKAVTSLLDKKAALATAERNLEKLAEGTYTDNNYIEDTFANIQENIKVKQAEYDAAKADYDTASAQLKALLAIFLK